MSGSNDWRGMFDRDYIGAWDLPPGKDVAVVIAKVKAGELTAPGGRKSKKPLVWFEGKEKALALNKTNAKTIAAMYGNDTAEWIGKPIALFATTTTFGSEQVECIRIRPKPPNMSRRQQRDEQPAPNGGADGSS